MTKRIVAFRSCANAYKNAGCTIITLPISLQTNRRPIECHGARCCTDSAMVPGAVPIVPWFQALYR
jgi:hypothetical protein